VRGIGRVRGSGGGEDGAGGVGIGAGVIGMNKDRELWGGKKKV